MWEKIVTPKPPKSLYHATVIAAEGLDPSKEPDGLIKGTTDEVIAFLSGMRLALPNHKIHFIAQTTKAFGIYLRPESIPLTEKELLSSLFFMTEVLTLEKDRWRPVSGHPSCWYTDQPVAMVYERKKIRMADWLRTRRLTIHHNGRTIIE